jgi:hypothetical protein
MNQRIRQLADQAKQSALDAMIKITDKEQALKVYSESYDTEFAELIVRECAEIAYNKQYKHSSAHTRGDCAEAIKEHFGVEE